MDNFKQLVLKCIQETEKKDTETLEYDWFFDEENNQCFALEKYADSEASLNHTKNVWDLLQEMGKISSLKYYLLGDPSEALLEATASSRAGLYAFLSGLKKSY